MYGAFALECVSDGRKKIQPSSPASLFRSETALEKSSFQRLFAKNRCVVFMQGSLLFPVDATGLCSCVLLPAVVIHACESDGGGGGGGGGFFWDCRFYEWREEKNGTKQPYFVHFSVSKGAVKEEKGEEKLKIEKDEGGVGGGGSSSGGSLPFPLMPMAALRDHWTSPDGAQLDEFLFCVCFSVGETEGTPVEANVV